MKHDPPLEQETPASLPVNAEQHAPAPLPLDADKYRPYLEEFDLTEDQKDELLLTLWHILRTFVDIGFGLDSVQMIFPAMVEKARAGSVDPLEETIGTEPFNQAALTHKTKEERDE